MSHPDLRNVPLRPSPEVVCRPIAGEQIFVPVRKGAAQMDYLFTANDVGSVIFGLLDGRRALAEIAGLLSQEFRVDDGEARADVLEFLETLYDAGLVRLAEEAP